MYKLQSTMLNMVTSVRGHFFPIKRRTLLKYFVLASMCESYSGPAKSGPIKRVDCISIFGNERSYYSDESKQNPKHSVSELSAF